MYIDDNLEFIKESFRKNEKLNFDYSWRHARATANCLKNIVEKFGEMDEIKIRNIALAGLGHDLLEDTEVPEELIEEKWGREVLSYIKGMTNRKGDENFDEYIEKLQNGSEEILLIKFSDIYTNILDSIVSIERFDKKWLNEFWLPLLERYANSLYSREFIKFPKTAKFFIDEINNQNNKLIEIVKRTATGTKRIVNWH